MLGAGGLGFWESRQEWSLSGGNVIHDVAQVFTVADGGEGRQGIRWESHDGAFLNFARRKQVIGHALTRSGAANFLV